MAIAETSKKYGAYCHSISFNILNNHEDAEECVNDTYLNVWNAIPPTKPQRFMVFIGRITRNISLNLFKKKNTQKRGGGEIARAIHELEECIAGNSRAEESVEYELITNCINNYLTKQNSLNADIFIRRYWYMDKVSTISERFSLNENTVTSILFRMRKELKSELEKEGVFV